jgi:hypothetical protein
VVLAGASTYALGKVFQYHFENGGTIYNFDVDKMKKKGVITEEEFNKSKAELLSKIT